MKSITIIGNLGANAVRRATSEGKELMSFNVAVNQSDGSCLWFNCIGNMREKLLPYLVKGQCVCVIGDLSARLYNNQIDLQINVDKTELCGSKPEDPKPATDQPATDEKPAVETY